MVKKEIRSYGQLTNTNNVESRKVEGYAALFNSRSVDFGGWTEEIAPGAFDGVIERSTVLALMDHNVDRGILARSVNGEGSLKLSVDERGLCFEFEAPNTPLGDELLEMIKRSDITTCSFAFTVDSDSWYNSEDGTCLRTINKIDRLYDVSPVYSAAYPETSIAVAQRSFEAFKAELEKRAEEEADKDKGKDKDDDEKTPDEGKDTTVAEDKEDDNNSDGEKADEKKETDDNKSEDDEVKEEDEEKKSDDNKSDDKKDEKSEDEDEKDDINKEDKEDSSEEEKQDKQDKRNRINTMEKFSLIKTIRSIVNNQAIDEVNQAVLELGKEEMRKSGLSYSGQIQLPFETRADVAQATVTGAGEEIVATEKLNILEPLKNRLVFTELGANYMTGLVGNISIPTYTGSTAGWAGEIDEAANGLGQFGSVEYSPKRITAYIDISKQFINQDSVGAEALLRQDIVDAVAQVLESTVLGDEAGSNTKPAGIFNGATAEDITYANLVAAEEKLEEANIPGEYKFVVSPAIKAAMKQTTVGGTKSDLRMLLENGEANGYGVVSTGNSKGIALANWSDLIICQFGSMDLVIDPYTVATKGCIRIVVNAYFDAKFRRPESVVANTKNA